MNKVQQRIWKAQSQKGTPKFVMIAISDHADEKGECFPSLGLISEKTGYSVRHCQRIIDALVKKGELEIVSGGGRKSNTYRFPKYMTDSPISVTEGDIENVTPDTDVIADTEMLDEENVTPDIYVVAQTDNTPDTDVTPDISEGENCHPTHDIYVTPPMTPMSNELSYNIDTSTIKPLSANYVVAPVGDNTTHTPSTVSDNPTVTEQIATPPTAEIQPSGTIASPIANDPPKAQVPNPETSTTIEGNATSLDLATKSDTEAHANNPPPVVPPREETVTRKRAKPVAEEKSQTTEKAPRTYSDQQKMVSAICNVFGWDMSKLTRNNRGLVGKVARDLLEASATPADVQGLYDFCKAQNWSGAFTPSALSSQWANYYALKHKSGTTADYIENEAGMIFYRYVPDPNRPPMFNYNRPLVTITEEELATGPQTIEECKAEFERVLAELTDKMTLKPDEVDLDAIPEDEELRAILW